MIAEFDSAQPGRAERLQHVTLARADRHARFRIERLWHHDGRPVLKLAGVDSISDAEIWAGAAICVQADERIQPAAGEYLHQDLIGCVLENAAGQIGVVRAVEDYGGAPLLRVEKPAGGELLVPFARSICREIDVAAKRIRAELPEGLTEL
jgi:16S rRNA processing protein RimM